MRRSSDDEAAQQDRAERMVRDAITRATALQTTKTSVYAKGSYPNNTNVRRDSDVDIVVQNEDLAFYEFAPGLPAPVVNPSPYQGSWTHAAWRDAVVAALRDCFGSAVDTSGSVAIHVPAVAGSRPPIDIVPAFPHYYYLRGDRSAKHDGSCVYTTAGSKIVNYPQQQLVNGRAKNDRTGRRYKRLVRALKNAENELVRRGTMKALPSYFMECLVYNVDDGALTPASAGEAFRQTLLWLWRHLNDEYVYESWREPNGIKYLFWTGQKWSRDDAKSLVSATYALLGY
jgi:hypothetical protein